MARAIDPMGSFLEGYREQQLKRSAEEIPHILQATDVLDLFANKRVASMTMFEISSQLMIRPQEAKRLVADLANRKLVSIQSTPDGNDLVTVTERGKLFIEK